MAAARAALPAGEFTGVSGPVDCAGRSGAQLTGPAGRSVTITVTEAPSGACRTGCTRVPGTTDAFQRAGTVFVYGDGHQVTLSSPAGSPAVPVAARVAAGRAVIRALG